MEYDESLLLNRTDNVEPTTAAEHKHMMTLHCQQCNTVLADSVGVCGEMRCMDCIMCIRVTNDVVVSDVMVSGHDKEMTNCIYSTLKCGSCHSVVGKVIHSAPSRLASIRSLFLLHKANISCYILDSCSMVKASTLTFDLKPLRGTIAEMRQQFEAQLDHTLYVKSRLADISVTNEMSK
ncbi:protein Mis18-beta [Odontesthes bonariensis]|uniref:protein Mis18-beta n=1 Tax=Odontesthes bonariensis TaxID=219752 RepID=UPI003F58886D